MNDHKLSKFFSAPSLTSSSFLQIFLTTWGRFHQHFRPTFSRAQDEKPFFGEWRLANGAQIQQTAHQLGEFQLKKWGKFQCSLGAYDGEIEQRNFCRKQCVGKLSLGEKSLVKSTPNDLLVLNPFLSLGTLTQKYLNWLGITTLKPLWTNHYFLTGLKATNLLLSFASQLRFLWHTS